MAATGMIIITAGCGSIAATSTVAANSHTATSAPAASSSPSLGKIGSTFTVSSDSVTDYLVTLTKIEQNAHGIDEFNQAGAGYHLVAVIFTVKGGKQTAHDNVNVNAVVLGSDKQLYDFDTDSVTGYTNFNSGDFTVSPGEKVTGAVVFKLPAGVTATKVMWAAPLSSSTAAWNVR